MTTSCRRPRWRMSSALKDEYMHLARLLRSALLFYREFHQQPEVKYSPCFENDDLPCRLHEKHVVFRVNPRSRNRVDSSLQVDGGCSSSPWGGRRFTSTSDEEHGEMHFRSNPSLCMRTDSVISPRVDRPPPAMAGAERPTRAQNRVDG